MAYLLIIIGIVCLAAGIYTLSRTKSQALLPTAPHPTTAPTADDRKEKGNQFEDYMIQRIGHIKGVSLLGKNADYHKQGISAEENKEPDLKWAYQGKPFAVECKYRAAFQNDKLQWAKDYQVAQYKKYSQAKSQPVYIAIGVSGTPAQPQQLYLVPLSKLPYGFATRAYLQPYLITDDKAIQLRIEN